MLVEQVARGISYCHWIVGVTPWRVATARTGNQNHQVLNIRDDSDKHVTEIRYCY